MERKEVQMFRKWEWAVNAVIGHCRAVHHGPHGLGARYSGHYGGVD